MVQTLLIKIILKTNVVITNIGQMIAKFIQYKGNKDYNYYLNKTVNSVFTFKNVDEETVKNTINNLPQKPAVDLMEFLNFFLQIIESAIIKSLTLLINQVLNTDYSQIY